AAGAVRAEVLLPQRHRVRRRRDGVVGLRQEDDPGPARQRGSVQAAVRPGGRPDPEGPRPGHRATHRRQVPRGARHLAVASATAGAPAAVSEAGARERADAVPLIVSGRGMTLTPALKMLIAGKITRLARVVPRIVDARVVCVAEKFRRTARITLRARRGTFTSEATAGDLPAALDAAAETLKRQLREATHRRTATTPPPP